MHNMTMYYIPKCHHQIPDFHKIVWQQLLEKKFFLMQMTLSIKYSNLKEKVFTSVVMNSSGRQNEKENLTEN